MVYICYHYLTSHKKKRHTQKKKKNVYKPQNHAGRNKKNRQLRQPLHRRYTCSYRIRPTFLEKSNLPSSYYCRSNTRGQEYLVNISGQTGVLVQGRVCPTLLSAWKRPLLMFLFSALKNSSLRFLTWLPNSYSSKCCRVLYQWNQYVISRFLFGGPVPYLYCSITPTWCAPDFDRQAI